MNKKIVLFTVLTILILALAIPHLALAMGLFQEAPPPLQVPDTLAALFLGFATFFITEGLKKLYPPLSGLGTQLAAVAVSTILLYVNGFLAGITNPIGTAAVNAVFYFLITVLSSYGLKRIEINLRQALLPRSAKSP